MFTSEEPTRFGIGCIGSRLMSGTLDPARAATVRDGEGVSLDEVRSAAGFSGPLESVALPAGHYHAFVELHIEQGSLLERAGLALGIITAIAAPATLRIGIEGEVRYAGGVLMPDRRDAFLAAAEVALAVESAAKGTGAIDTVGTVGICEIFPGAVNSIPSRVRMLADVRDIDLVRRDAVLEIIRNRTGAIAAARRVIARTDTVNADTPAEAGPLVVEALRSSAGEDCLPYQLMVSRAYHDTLFMARVAPAGMLFIPAAPGSVTAPTNWPRRMISSAACAYSPRP